MLVVIALVGCLTIEPEPPLLPPVISAFTASPSTLAVTAPVTLSWSVSGATSLRIEPGGIDVTGLAQTTVFPSSTTTYTLIASNASGDRTRDVEVVVSGNGNGSEDVPVISTFSASPDVVQAGGAVTLSWRVSGATSLWLGPVGANVTGLERWTVYPGATTTYTLFAVNSAGQSTSETTVTVQGDVDPELPVISTFEPAVTIVNPGLPNTLRWTVQGADSLTLTGPGVESGVDVSGTAIWTSSTALPPGAVFTLVASNGHGSVGENTLASRAVATISVLVAGQSNAQGVNLSATEARTFIAAQSGVRMLGNDYVWKPASEPLDDCIGQVDQVSADYRGSSCSSFATSNTSGVSFGVSLGNRLSTATGGEVLLIPSALGGSGALAWKPPSDPYDRDELFGSAAHRARLAAVDEGAPLGLTYAGDSFGVVAWFQGETDTSSPNGPNTYFTRTDAVFDGFQQVLGAPIILAQLSRRGPTGDSADPDGTLRNLRYQRVREMQRLMATGARTLAGTAAPEAEARRHLVVTHDLPLADGDGRHLSASAQVELGRRFSLAIREHLLNESVDGTGPRLVAVEQSSPTVVRVRADRSITAPTSTGATAYSSYFAVFSDGDQVPVSEIRRDPDDARVVRITLGQSVPAGVEIRYMPPPGALGQVAADVIRSATCSEPMPGTSLCLPMPAFGVATDAATASTLRFFEQFDDLDRE